MFSPPNLIDKSCVTRNYLFDFASKGGTLMPIKPISRMVAKLCNGNNILRAGSLIVRSGCDCSHQSGRERRLSDKVNTK
jgi:hypothetical protein